MIFIIYYADWTLYRNAAFCTDGSNGGFSSTVQDCQVYAEQWGYNFVSYKDDGNGNKICKRRSSCDTVTNESGWTIYQIYPNMSNEYQFHNICRLKLIEQHFINLYIRLSECSDSSSNCVRYLIPNTGCDDSQVKTSCKRSCNLCDG